MPESFTAPPITDFRLEILLEIRKNGRPWYYGWRTMNGVARLIADGYATLPDTHEDRNQQYRLSGDQIKRILCRDRDLQLDTTLMAEALLKGLRIGERRERQLSRAPQMLHALRHIETMQPKRVQNMNARPNDPDAPTKVWNFAARARLTINNAERRK
jgi:hypothetical protein